MPPPLRDAALYERSIRWARSCALRQDRQPDHERGAAARRLRHLDVALVEIDRLLHDGEAQPGPIRLLSEIRFEDPAAFLRGDARSLVRDRHPNPSVPWTNRGFDSESAASAGPSR